MKSKNTVYIPDSLQYLCFIWDFNCQVGSSLADWFYSMPTEQRKNIKKAIFATEGMLDCNPGFPEALRRYKINQAIEAILK